MGECRKDARRFSIDHSSMTFGHGRVNPVFIALSTNVQIQERNATENSNARNCKDVSPVDPWGC